jgi:prophage regulatory protein
MRILKRKDVEDMTGLKRSSIYLKMANNEFPKQIKLGARSVGWLLSDVENWINQKISETRGM